MQRSLEAKPCAEADRFRQLAAPGKPTLRAFRYPMPRRPRRKGATQVISHLSHARARPPRDRRAVPRRRTEPVATTFPAGIAVATTLSSSGALAAYPPSAIAATAATIAAPLPTTIASSPAAAARAVRL